MKTEEIRNRIRYVIGKLPEYEDDAHYMRIDHAARRVEGVLFDALDAQAREIASMREALEDIVSRASYICYSHWDSRHDNKDCAVTIARRALEDTKEER